MSSKILPFDKGVLGVLHGRWEFILKTPMVIRCGNEGKTKAAFRQHAKELKKGRGRDMAFAWKDAIQKRKDSPKEWSEVTDFNYHFFVNDNNELDVAYSIPASSIRGSLRQWTIKCLVERENRGLFSMPKRDDTASELIDRHINDVREEMEKPKKGWYDILSLFGCAFDLDPNDPLTWAGRLRLTTEILSDSSDNKPEAAGIPIDEYDGPQNIKRHINVRNPIDRVTMAAKDGGLHFGLEMSEGEKFAIDFHILNPKQKDIELLNLWTQDINDGFLRFGGLTSQGRGRVELDEKKEQYQLYVSRSSALFSTIQSLAKPTVVNDELFTDIWLSVVLTRAELMSLDIKLLDQV